MPSNNQVRIGVGFDIDQTGINKIKSELQSLQKLTEKDLKLQVGQDATKELEKIKSSAAQVESALSRAFNSDLGTLNVAKFNTELKNLNLSKIAQDFSAAGAAGQKCFNDITAKALTSNIQLKQTFSIVEKMRTTLANTIKWQVASSAINSMTSSVQQAFSYVKQLDTALTDIRIVTGDSSEEMAKFAVQANKAAQELGRTTKDYAKAALTYYQQGLGDDEVRARTEATLKAANVTGAAVSEVAEDLTAVWNGYKITTEETTLAVDKLAAVADSSASDLSELATAMSKVASIGNNMGVSIDQLNAQISTIIATTRQAPETVGNALKTIYARINDIVAGTDEAETSLGNYSGQMASLGISVLDSNGKLRDTGEVMEEIGSKWGNMTREQQVYLAKTMAGQRQMNNLIALFDNWTQYQQMINVSMSSAGSLDEKNARYMESIAAHAKSFSAALEGVQDSLIDEDSIKSVYDLGTDLLNLVNQFVKSIGGGRGAILGLSTILTSLFEKQIANGLLTIRNNRQAVAYNEELIESKKELLHILNQEAEKFGEENSVIANNIKAMTELYNVAEQYGVSLDESNQKAIDGFIKEKAAIYNTRAEYQNFLEDLEKRDYTSQKNRAQEDEGGMQTATNLFEKDKLSSVDEEGHLVLDEEKIKQAQSALEEQKNTYENLLGTVKRYQSVASQGQKEEIKNNLEISAINKKIGDQRDVAEEDVRTFVEAEDKRVAAIEKAKNAADNLTSALFEQSNSIPLEQWEKLSSILADQATGDMPYDEFFRKVNQVLREGQIEVEKTTENLEGLRAQAAKTNGDLDNLKNKEKGFFDILKDKAITESIAGVLKGVSQLTMGLNSLFNIFDTFDQLRKKEISGWEAFTRVVMGASMALPMLVGGIKSASLGLAGLAGAVSAEAAAAKASAVANGGFIASLKALSTAIYEVPIVGWILAIVSAIIALIAIIAKMKKTADQRLKEHRESISKLKNAYQEATKASQELADSFNEYDSLIDKLNDCTKGTKEWAAALTEVNNKVLELTEKYPELLKYVERGESGQLIISEEGQREFQKQLNQQTITAQTISVAASSQERREEEADEAITRSSRIGLAQEDLLYLAEKGYGKTSEELVSLYKDYLTSLGVEDLSEYEYYIDAIRDNSEEIQKLTKTVHENNIATQAENDALAASIVSGNENLSQSEYSKEITQQISASFEEVNQKTLRRLELDGWGTKGIRKLSGANAEAKKIFEEYAKAIGLTGATLVDTTGTDSNRKFVYKDSEGNKQTIGLEEMRLAKAAADAQQEVENTAKVLVETLKNLDAGRLGKTENEQAAQGLKSIISREGLLGATKGQRDALYDEIAEFGGFNDEGIAAWLDSTFGDGLDNVLSKESLEKLGFTSNAEAVKEIREAYEEATNLEKEIPKQLLESVKNVYNNLNLDNLTVSQKDIIAKNLEQAFVNGSQKGLDNAQNIIQKTIATGQADEFASVVEGMDFSTISIQQFRDALDAAGVSAAQFSDTELDAYIRSMADAATKTVEELTETYAELTKITSKLSQGDTISAEDYQKLADQGLSHFFDLMLDGTYQLNERAEKLNEILHDTQVDNFREQIDVRQQQVQDYERISKYDFDALSRSTSAAYSARPSIKSSEQVEEQLDILQTLGGADKEAIAKWREGLQLGALGNEDLKEIAEAVQGVEGQFKTLDSTIEETTNSAFALEVAIAKSYDNIDDMRAALEQGEFSLQAFNQAVIDLDEITDVENLNPEEFKAFIDYIQDAADDSTLLADSLEDDADAAYIVAKSMMKMNLGVEDLSDNWEDWNDILSNSAIASEEYGEAMESTIEALSNLLDVDSSFVSADFVREHLEDITSAAEGSEEAIDNLRDELKTSIVAKIALQNEIEVSDLESDLQNVQSLLDDLGPLEIGTVVTDGDFLNSCQEMIKNADMTADQVNALFDSMGFEPTFASEEIPISNEVPIYVTHHEKTNEKPDGSYDEETWTWQKGTQKLPGHMTAVGLSTDGTVPKITGVTKKVTSASANSSSLNTGGKGKSSSSSKSSKKDKKDPLEDTRDIYHDINIEISDYETSLKRIQTEQEHLTGKGLIKNLQEQVKLLDKQKDAYLRKAELQKQDLINQQKVLAGLGATFDQYGNISNYMSVLGEKQQFVNNLTNQYNNLIDQYNNADETRRESLESQLETLEEQLDIAQKDYDLTEKKIGDYDSLMDDIQEVQDNIQELTNQQIELQIEAFNAEIKVSLDLSQAERDWNEFRKKVINRVADEDYLGLAAATAASFDSYYKTNSTGEVQELTEHLTKITDEVQKMTTGGHSSIYSAFNEQTGLWTNNYSKAQEDLKEYLDKLMSTLENADAVITEVHNNIMSEIAETQEAIDNQKKNYEQIDELINHDIKMLQLLRGEDSYEEMAHYYEEKTRNDIQQVDLMKQAKDMWQAQAAEAQARRDRFEEGTADWERLNAEYEEYNNNYLQAMSDLNSAIEKAIESASEQLKNAIQSATKAMNDSLFGGDYNRSQEEWENQKYHNDRYVDDINRATALLDLQRDINEAITSASTKKAQKELADYRDAELKALKEKEHLTQNDIDMANKRLEIYQKQMALEDAQNAKTNMRLVRDSQGNYTYQYRADEDKVANAQEELEKSLTEYFNMAKDGYREVVDEIYSVADEAAQKLAEVTATYGESSLEYQQVYEDFYGEHGKLPLLYEEAASRAKDIEDSSYQYLKMLRNTEGEDFASFLGEGGEIQNAINELLGPTGDAKSILDDFVNNTAEKHWDALSEQTKDALIGEDSILSTWNLTINNIADNIEEKYETVVKKCFDDIFAANDQWVDQIGLIEQTSGQTLEKIAEGTDLDVTAVQELLKSNKDLISAYQNELTAINQVGQNLEDLILKYGKARDMAIQAAKEAAKAWEDANNKAGVYQNPKSSGSTVTNFVGNGASALSSITSKIKSLFGSGGETSGGGNPDTQKGGETSTTTTTKPEGLESTFIKSNAILYTADGKKLSETSIPSSVLNTIKGQYLFTQEETTLQAPNGDKLYPIYNSNGNILAYVKNRKEYKGSNGYIRREAYEKGGYTGDWAGGYGKPAILHSSEYVLNAKDTPNVLRAVNIARGIMDKVGSINSSMLDNLARTGILTTSQNSNTNTTSQVIEINASFPNANNASEIEQALNNLVNSASQRANKSRRIN